MRFRFKPTPDQRAALRARLARLQQPAALLDILAATLPADFDPTGVTCTVPSAHSDRFVMRAQVRSAAGDERAFALKVKTEEHTSELQSPMYLVCRLLLEKKNTPQ